MAADEARDERPSGAQASFDLFAQLEHHFRWLSRAISDVSPEDARHALGPERPSIAWLTGHLIEGAASVAEAVAAIESPLPRSFAEQRARPYYGAGDEAGWTRLRGTWEQVAVTTTEGLLALAPGALQRPPAIEIRPEFVDRLSTRGAFLAGEVFHFAYHLGQIGSLRADLGLGWG